MSDASSLDKKNRCWIRRKQWRRCKQLELSYKKFEGGKKKNIKKKFLEASVA